MGGTSQGSGEDLGQHDAGGVNMTDGIEIGLGGKSVRLTGPHTILIVAVLGLLGFLGWLFWDMTKVSAASTVLAKVDTHSQKNNADHDEIKSAIKEQTEVIREKGQKQIDQAEFQNYMLFFATDEEKKNIKQRLHKPKILQDMDEEERRRHR